MGENVYFISEEDKGKYVFVGPYEGVIADCDHKGLIPCDLKCDELVALSPEDTCRVKGRDLFHAEVAEQTGKRVFIRWLKGADV